MFETLPTSAFAVMDWKANDIQPYFDDLVNRPLSTATIDQFLKDWTLLGELVTEAFSRLSVATTQNTADEESKKRYLSFIENLFPVLQMAEQKLKEKLLESKLEPKGFEIPLRNMRVEAEIFREANIPLTVEESKLRVNFDEIVGGLKLQWKGQTIPLTEILVEGQNPNRSEREQAWHAAHQTFIDARPAINELWNKFLDVRVQMAQNAGFESYIPYRWKSLGRFDYTPENCAQFHDAIEKVVVPAVERILKRKAKELGVEVLRPWDLNCDPTHNQTITFDTSGKPALKPYQTIEEMESRSAAIFKQVDPVLGEYFETMRREQLLDLGSRLNKANTGYCTTYQVVKRPFIFMNAVGIHDNVQTLLHEAGHAFHAFESVNQPYFQLRDYPIEFAEVASMSMELLAGRYLSSKFGGYYSDADAARAFVQHLEGMLTFWPYMAVVDSFQLWVYSNVDDARDPAKCDAKWLELWRRFIKGVDWSGLEEIEKTGWHRKLHIHQIPFYYVEYGLAQLGSAQVWAKSLNDPSGAVANYRKALALGGSVTLPELYTTAGAKFAFDAETLGGVVSLIEKTITDLSAVN